MEGKEPKVIVNEEGSRITPSVVAWDDKGEILVGQVAKRQASPTPRTRSTRPSASSGAASTRSPRRQARALQGVARKQRRRGVTVGQGAGAARGLGARAAQAEAAAENYLGETVTEAVITVPAYFNDAQRQATKDAGKIAGLEVKRIVNEPTAAALAYGLDKKKDELIAVYDFGGGTFDISILEVGENVVEVISPTATRTSAATTSTSAGHRLPDRRVQEGHGHRRLARTRWSLQRLKDAAEKAKIELSSAPRPTVNLPFLTADASGPKHLNIKLTRAKLEQMIEDPSSSARPRGRAAGPRGRGQEPGDIDEVILVGGSTRIPLVQETP
jgi:molecular chaperone DnaK